MLGFEDNSNIDFTFKDSKTPKVFSIENDDHINVHRFVDDVIRIHGINFDSVPLKNTVKFGGFTCDVVTSTATQIDCQMNKSEEPSTNTWLPISLSVEGKGNALVVIRSEYNYSVIFQHEVESITPLTGSQMGGTTLTIQGTGLDIEQLKISIGTSSTCDVIEQSYSEIKCLTSSGTGDQQIFVEDKRYEADLQRIQTDLTFKYDFAITPIISFVTPIKISEPNTLLEFVGTSLGATKETNTILIGDETFSVDSVSVSSSSTKLQLTITALPQDKYKTSVLVNGIGYAKFNDTNLSSFELTVEGKVNSIQPNNGSIYGGTKVTVNGFGFMGNQSTALIDGKTCTIVNADHTTITLITPKVNSAGSKYIHIDNSVFKPTFNFLDERTPTINSLSKSKGVAGDVITLNGEFYSNSKADYTIRFGNVQCTSINVINTGTVSCVLGIHSAGNVTVSVSIQGYGNSNNDLIFTYDLQATTSNSLSSGIGGGLLIDITGKGFSDQTTFTICNLSCHIIEDSDINLKCISPELINYNKEVQQISCTMKVAEGGLEYELSEKYVYDQDKTSTITQIDPSRVGTGGGVEITITGTGFAINMVAIVTIDDVPCEVLSVKLTEVKCRSTETNRTAINAKIILEFTNLGRAISNVKFDVVDVWSSRFTWGYKDPPKKGNFVKIDFLMN